MGHHKNSPEKSSYPRNHWYVAGWSGEVAGTQILRRKLLAREVVFFRNIGGQIVGLDARCPHRGADLGFGSVVDGEIQCPYHGWRFDGSGQCTLVPSQPPNQNIPASACVTSWPVVEQEGLFWVWMGDGTPNPAEPPHWGIWKSPAKSRRIDLPARLWSAGFVHVVEQTIDEAHPAFVHAKALPERSTPLVPHAQITVDDDQDGFQWEVAPDSPWQCDEKVRSFWNRWMRRHVQGIVEPERRRTSRLETGGVLHLRVEYANGCWDVLIFAITPQDELQTWTFVTSIRTRAMHLLGEYLQRRYLKNLVDEDVALAENLLYRDPAGFSTRVSVKADEPALIFRKLHERWLALEIPDRAARQTPPELPIVGDV